MDKELEKLLEDNRGLIDGHRWKELGKKVSNQGKWPILRDLLLEAGITPEEVIEDFRKLPSWVFHQCSTLMNITIPNSVTSIGESAFEDCNRLTSVVIGNGVESIGDRAFRSCNSLTSVVIGNSVTSIGDYAFFDCSRLTRVEIPNSVTSIGEDAFRYCRGLTSINYNGTKEQWNAISKGSGWDICIRSYTIHCTDGDLAKGE